jgi:hypothetical protein
LSERATTVRPYRPGDEASILALFNGVFGEGDARFETRTLEQWRWLYRDNPAGTQIVVSVEDDGTVVGHYACLPARARVDGEVVVAGQGIDSMVRADYRSGLKREGAFVRTARGYFEHFGHWPICAFGYGFPNRQAYPIGVRLVGYKPVFRPLPTLYRNFFEEGDDDAVGRETSADAARLDVVEVDRFGAVADELWTRLAPDFPFALVRDAAYLDWRYAACPWLGYRRYVVRERGGRVRALFVARANWQRQPIGALVDFLGAPDDAAAVGLALRTTTRLAREAGQARVEAWFPERSPWFRHALGSGFRSEPCQYVLCVMLYRERPDLEWVRERWYYTIGDSDVF